MAKVSGGVRTLKGGSKEYSKRETEVENMLASGKYSSVEFSKKGGGYVAIEKSSARHKPEELEAAHFLANKGYKVTLKDEAGELITTDGNLFNYSFEQRTPNGEGNRNFRYSLEHARNKEADVAIIYMKYNKHTINSVIDGLKQYEQFNDYRFKQIIVVTPDGRIHKHRHNKT